MGLDPGTSVAPRTAVAAEGSLPMLRARLCTAVGFLATVLSGAASSSDDASPGAILKAKGLRRQGWTYILPGEAAFSRKVAEAQALYRGYTEAVRQEEAMTRQLEADREILRQLSEHHLLVSQRLA